MSEQVDNIETPSTASDKSGSILVVGAGVSGIQAALDAAGSGFKCLMNSMLEFGITQAASLHLGCTLPNLMDCGHAYGSVTRMADDITDFGENISGGFVTVPSGPGLGVNLKEDKLKKYSVAHVKV